MDSQQHVKNGCPGLLLTDLPIPDESICLRTKFPPLPPPSPWNAPYYKVQGADVHRNHPGKGGFPPMDMGGYPSQSHQTHRGSFTEKPELHIQPEVRLGDCNIRRAPCYIPQPGPPGVLLPGEVWRSPSWRGAPDLVSETDGAGEETCTTLFCAVAGTSHGGFSVLL